MLVCTDWETKVARKANQEEGAMLSNRTGLSSPRLSRPGLYSCLISPDVITQWSRTMADPESFRSWRGGSNKVNIFAADCLSKKYQWKAEEARQEAQKPDLAPAKQMKTSVSVVCTNRIELQEAQLSSTREYGSPQGTIQHSGT